MNNKWERKSRRNKFFQLPLFFALKKSTSNYLRLQQVKINQQQLIFRDLKVKNQKCITVPTAFVTAFATAKVTAQQQLNQMRLQAIATAGNYLTAQELD